MCVRWALRADRPKYRSFPFLRGTLHGEIDPAVRRVGRPSIGCAAPNGGDLEDTKKDEGRPQRSGCFGASIACPHPCAVCAHRWRCDTREPALERARHENTGPPREGSVRVVDDTPPKRHSMREKHHPRLNRINPRFRRNPFGYV